MTKDAQLDQRGVLEALFGKLVLDTSRRTYASTLYLRAIASPRKRGNDVWIAIHIQPERPDVPWPISECAVQVADQDQCEAHIEADGRVLIGPVNNGRHRLRVAREPRPTSAEPNRKQIGQFTDAFLDVAVKARLQSLFDALRTLVLPLPSLATRGGPLAVRGVRAKDPVAHRVIAEGSVFDGRLRWRFTEEPSGALNGLIVSTEVELLRGASVWLTTEPPREVALVETAGEQRAEFVISKEERRRLRGGPVVQKIVFPNGSVIAPDK